MLMIDIYKNWIDYTWGWANVAGALLIPILIWFFGSSRFEANKIKKEEQESLNYLLTSIYRYFQYFINLKQMVINKQLALIQFLDNPIEELKIQSFSIFTPPAVDFDITPSKYAFTISKENLIVDIIFQFLQTLSDVNGTLEYINNDMKKIFDENLPIETFVKIAQGNVSANIPGLIYKINMGLFMMFRLMEIVEDYNKYLDKKYKLMAFFVPQNVINLIQSIKIELITFTGNNDWEKPFMNPIRKETKTLREKIIDCWNNHIKNILKNLDKKQRNTKMDNLYKYLSLLLNRDITSDKDIQEDDIPKLKEALNKAWETRNFEIELYWKRALYFWGFIALAFTSLFAILNIEKDIFSGEYFNKFLFLTLNSIVGAFLSFGWYLANRGSKFWQINWEKWINYLEKYKYGNLYSNPIAPSEIDINIFNAGNFSLSRINIIICLVITAVWGILAVLFGYHINTDHGVWSSIITVLILMMVGTILFYLSAKSSHNNDKK